MSDLPHLIAEDLLLLLLDDDTGTMAASTYEKSVLGGALLAELALVGAVEVEKGAGIFGRTTWPARDSTREDAVTATTTAMMAAVAAGGAAASSS